ncbi:hypothetical protein FRC18_007775, partial [Serendipita sp. 400]
TIHLIYTALSLSITVNSQSGIKSSIDEDFWHNKISDEFLFRQLSRQKGFEKASELEERRRGEIFIQTEEDFQELKQSLEQVFEREIQELKRQKKAIADMAYCLIDIFRINLSIAYGEKEGASYRLQVEIMRNSED